MHLLFLSILTCPPASATRAACELALRTVQAAVGEGPRTENYDSSVKGETDARPTVEVVQSEAGVHGGKILTLERIGARWISDYRTVQFDPQGDPRWFIEVMGPRAAEFFGFKILSDRKVRVPDGNEFNGALEKINKQLKSMGKEPIEIRFYVTPGNENTMVAEYVRDFGFRGGLPLAASGNHLLHDLSFHTGAIFIPGDLVRLSRFFARYLDLYLKFLEEKYAAEPEKSAAVKHYAFLLRMNQTISIDTATGVVNPGIVASLRKPGETDSLVMLFAPSVILSGQGKTVRQYFEDKVYSLDPAEYFYANEFGEVDDEKLAARAAKTQNFLRHLSRRQLLADMAEFHKLKRTEGHDQFADRAVPQEESILESFCKGFSQRRLVIRQAVGALMGAQ